MNNKTLKLAQLLHEATVALDGTLVQLDYLQELVNKTKLTDKQRQAVNQQIHRIKVNNTGVKNSLAIMPKLGHAK
ncbi:hypothetical protein [Levilactobacillus brevis]|uniref:hypothetical protein n=1 Tax=Levilactobacillus brevis TaxID=1580 RepID=UPI00063AF841|nr:hypothetical protein [Levilactobacillus brevis]KLE30995.1 hypothetical protein AAX72_01005 [Levilactobacillus brevis]KWU40594.1 hypothetical protein AV935_06805 [Levilactobacillus brevis]MCT3568345.1 hypothetical protein [Levilactobacillus brevis]MCT3577484.1 hypothetical protein [Levilactobacillus brevis]MDM5047019.1 hypothetical protein [Levilactobacillus brevis]